MRIRGIGPQGEDMKRATHPCLWLRYAALVLLSLCFTMTAARSAQITNVYSFAGTNGSLIPPSYILGAHVFQGNEGIPCNWLAWQSGYGNIGGATYAAGISTGQRIHTLCPLTIKPTPGYELAFNSFALAVYPAPQPNDLLTTLRWGYKGEPPLFEQSTQTVVPGGANHLSLSPNTGFSDKTFEITWFAQREQAWNVGLGQFSITTLTTVAITQAFAPATIRAGQQSTFTLTLSISDDQIGAQTGINLRETLPAGMTVASAPNPSQCGGVVSASVGGNTIELNGGSLGAFPASCTISVQVTAPAGSYTNATGNLAHNTSNALDGPWTFDETNLGSATLTVAPVTISGTVFEDVSGDLLADGTIGGLSNPGLSGRTVRLFNSAGAQVGPTATTGSSGAYQLNLDSPGTYYVAVDAPTVTAAGTSGVVAEQTYASAGGGNGGTAGGAGYGPLCVSTDGSYIQQNAATTSNAASNPANGACYGGRRGAVADSGTTALDSKEHMIRVVSDGSAEIVGVDFGFSFNVVTNVNDAGQGSLRQFIANANAITATSGAGGEPDGGANSLRFVPALPMNGSDWWQIAPASQLPAIAAPRTTIDGTAYDNVNGTSAFLRGAIGTGGLVGADWNSVVLSQVQSPKLALANGLSADALTIAASANDTTIQNFGVFGTTGGAGGGITKTAAGTITGLLLRGNVLGVLPNGAASGGTLLLGLRITDTANGSFEISNNYIEGPRDAGIQLGTVTHGAPGNYIVSNNEVADTGSDAIQLFRSSHITLQGNLVARSDMVGIELWENGGNNLLTQNSVVDSRGTGSEAAAVRLTVGSNNIVTFNRLVGSTGGPGILQRNSSTGNRLSQNQFGGNAGNAIDNSPSDAPDGVTISSACVVNGTQLGRPVLSSAVLIGNSLQLAGSYCATGTYRLEVYKVASGSTGDIGSGGLQAGEGGTYLGALTGLSGGALNSTLPLSPGELVAGSDHVTAILIRETAIGGAEGDTSEFSANALTVSVPFITLAKVSLGGVGAFSFAGGAVNGNGFPADGSYVVVTVAPDQAVDGAPVPLAAADAATEIVETMPAGWVLEGARCEDRRAATTGNPAGPVIGSVADGRTLLIPAENAKAGADLLCTFTNRFRGLAVEGRVILDNGIGGGIAHNAIQDGAEQGLSTVSLRLTDCGGLDYARGESDAAGHFALSLAAVPAGTPACLERAALAGHLGVSLAAGDTGGAAPTPADYGVLRFTPAADTGYSGVVFGLIAIPALATPGKAVVEPGGATLLPHRYSATTTGEVAFSLADVTGVPDAALFATTILRDADCSGTIEAGEGPVPATTAVQAGDVICLLVRVQAGVNAPEGGKLDYALLAATALSGTLAVLQPASNQDNVIVGTGTVSVTKRVRNVTQGGAFGVSSTGAPGDVLEYSIIFINPSSGMVGDVKVHDETPEYTTLDEATAVVQDPGGLDCQPAVPPGGGSAGYAGPLRWDCTGTMPPGDKGEVSFKVRIDQ